MQYWGTGRLSTHQSVSYGTAAGTITNGVGAQTYKVRVVATTAAYVTIAKAPTATTSHVYIPAAAVEYFTITPGEKVSAIRVADDGVLHVTEIT